VVERHTVLLARLLKPTQTFQISFETNDLALEFLQLSGLLSEMPLARLQPGGQFARLAFHRERSGAGLLTASNGVAVIADAIRKEEIKMRISSGEPLSGLPILREEAE